VQAQRLHGAALDFRTHKTLQICSVLLRDAHTDARLQVRVHHAHLNSGHFSDDRGEQES